MGAAGNIILCENGHELGYIEDDVHWDENVWKELERLRNATCERCGKKAKYDFSHYGNINDCIEEGKLEWDASRSRHLVEKLPNISKYEIKNKVLKSPCYGCKHEKSHEYGKDNILWNAADECYSCSRLAPDRYEKETEKPETTEREKELAPEMEKFKETLIEEEAKSYGISKEKFLKYLDVAEGIMKECELQSHLHGEISPTPHFYIARECFLKGYVHGSVDRLEEVIDALGIRDRINTEKERVRRLRAERQMGRIINKIEAERVETEGFFEGEHEKSNNQN